jgi:NAD(P)-dependent dehydrogenase (short-subunit alcohol dehydrogenase family)
VWHSLVASGVEGAVRALAVELAPVRVNAVAPGAIDTPMLDRALGADKEVRTAAMAARLPARRVGSATDAAEAVLFLMTNRFMTGATLEIDGGAVLV